MSSELLKILSESSPLAAIMQLEKMVDPELEQSGVYGKLDEFVNLCQASIKPGDLLSEKLNRLFDCFYNELALGVKPVSTFFEAETYTRESDKFKLSHLLSFRSGSELLLAVLVQYIAEKLDLDIEIMVSNQLCLLRFQQPGQRAKYFNAANGKPVSEDNVPQVFSDADNPDDSDDGEEQAGISHSHSAMLGLHLKQWKESLLFEDSFDEALLLSNLLVKLNPTDPYARRDRGILLQQLDCQSNALTDFRFFIFRCPEDPSAQLIKAQLQDFTPSAQTIH